MKLFGHWFIVKRPYMAVLKQSVIYKKDFAPKTDLDHERLSARVLGFEDGYVKCLEDLGLNQTIENYNNKKKIPLQ
jgi:hypothetical protein